MISASVGTLPLTTPLRDLVEELCGALRADRPLAEQAAGERGPLAVEAVVGDEVEHDRVVVAGVEDDVVGAACLGDGAHDVDRAVSVEGRDLDRDDVRDLRELPPERVLERTSAGGGLEVEAEDRDHLGDGAAVIDQLVVGRVRESAEAEEGSVESELDRRCCLGKRLSRRPDDACDEDRVRVAVAGRLGGELEHRAVQVDARRPDRELRRVDTDGDPAGTGVDVVAREAALAALVELPLGRERERVGRDHEPFGQPCAQRFSVQKRPSRVSKCVGLPSVGRSSATQAAVHSSSCLAGTRGGP